MSDTLIVLTVIFLTGVTFLTLGSVVGFHLARRA